jgi:hypothetical protein
MQYSFVSFFSLNKQKVEIDHMLIESGSAFELVLASTFSGI